MAAGWRIRGFELDRRLGAGASSEVWRATASSSGDAVALKRLPLSGAEQARRAVAEAAKLRVLDHPHLVRLHDLVLHRDAAVLVLDLADAGSLADLLAVRGRLTPGEAITAIAPVAAALAHVHAAGLVHGDVSPANILFTPGGVPLLADLGVSRLTGDDADAESTPAYVDPLVARGGVPTSHTDVFMLGAVALHVLTGAALWTAGSGDAALAQASSAGLGHVEGRLAMADLPPAMAAVLRRALTLEPARRGSAADFALDLRHSGAPVAVELAAGRARLATPPAFGAGQARPAFGGVEARPACGGAAGAQPAAPVTDPFATTPRRPPGPPAVSASPVDPPVTDPPATGPSVVGPPVVEPRRAGHSGGGGRHAATPVTRPRRRPDARQTSAAERARALIANRAGRSAVPAPPGGAVPAASDAARPHFVRPSATVTGEVVVGRPAPTSAVARARPTLPAPGRRPSGRVFGIATGVVVVLLAATLVMLLRPHTGDAVAEGRPAAALLPSGTATGSGSTTADPTRPTTARAPAVPSNGTVPPSTMPVRATPPGEPDGAAVLRALDDIRARAFAARDDTLLSRVYVPGPLRAADTTSLHRLVPPGCSLRGLHTDYRAITTRPAHDTLVVTARASLPASHVVCSGRVVGTAGAVGPTELSITLVPRQGAMLIASERVIA